MVSLYCFSIGLIRNEAQSACIKKPVPSFSNTMVSIVAGLKKVGVAKEQNLIRILSQRF